MPAPSHFDPPVVVALFPSCAVLSWEPPRTSAIKSFAEHTSWDYRVEYSCSCRMRHQPYAMSTTDTYALLATAHPGETYYVRVVARETFAGSLAGLVSAKTSFQARSTMSMPWPTAAASPCIFDGLYLCAANAWDGGALASVSDSRRRSQEHGCLLDKSSSACVMDADAEFRLYRVTYDCRVPPANTRTVYYMAATGRRPRASQRMRSKEVAALLKRDNAALVFCGVGDSGRLAVKAAHALLSSFMTSCPALSLSVFCITYGTPRCYLKDGPQLLIHTLPLSYHFLHVTQLSRTDDGSSLGDDPVVSQRGTGDGSSPLRLTGYSEGFYENTLLGAQCRVAHDVNDGDVLQLYTSGPAVPLTAAEETEEFDVERALQRLLSVFFPSSPSWLVPTLLSIHCRSTGPLLYVTVEGSNLHYTPRLTLLPQQQPHGAAFPFLIECRPQQLTCVCSLLPWIEECVSEGGAVVGKRCSADLSLCTLVQTAFGMCAACPDEDVPLPRDLTELFQSTAEMTAPWVTAVPSELLECALQTQPLYALCRGPSSATGVDTALNPLAQVLCSFASAAETVLAEQTRAGTAGGMAAAGSVFGFMSNVAARFSSAVSSTSVDAAPKLSVPGKEAAFLKNALKEWTGNASAGIDVWGLRSASWKQRVLHGLPLLSDSSFRSTLTRLLRVFDLHVDAYEGAPHAWLEARLYAHVRRHVTLRLSSSFNMEELLSTTVTLSDFYAAVIDVFTSVLPASAAAPLPFVEDVLLLWCLCQCFELRRELSATFFCCTVGCPGCGGSTLSATLSTLLQSEDAFCYPRSTQRRRVPACRLASSRLSALFLAMRSGVRLAVFLAGELPDIVRPQYASMSMRIQENLTFESQHWFRVITKADEHLPHVRGLGGAPLLETSADRFLEEAKKEMLGGDVVEEHRLVISLAPSPPFIGQILRCSQEKAHAFAASLRAASQRALLPCLLLSLQQADATARQ
ncbi:hypothetical protein ABB37_02010 [Leptomonas pyrrhocoris]|uniref:Fibronectin type-III domain-containing protein n=1 Tax=Leptomonas pyrrhocoris TaxID=157538 RepID=A0A0M9G709_LEPPY|nr:hypothetical protein ABB37_02010 [Leptomonas pyrrhocoris]XP_015662226.1 hypothetical protein ABB37_02010 [Leptomonas pyrrhocoris]KPA83786.1 hypothetical protein ABB37_02010 [Leptomonas pyrrhocoris]KPA83787.1 hypothetical protein ABB37_02010 [Leptomonas pyrrhocoris]|eukprot:XP_015662225.1 hypothetical protein ABB37_02010 [Leptomonas pyrrhocoris]